MPLVWVALIVRVSEVEHGVNTVIFTHADSELHSRGNISLNFLEDLCKLGLNDQTTDGNQCSVSMTNVISRIIRVFFHSYKIFLTIEILR